MINWNRRLGVITTFSFLFGALCYAILLYFLVKDSFAEEFYPETRKSILEINR